MEGILNHRYKVRANNIGPLAGWLPVRMLELEYNKLFLVLAHTDIAPIELQYQHCSLSCFGNYNLYQVHK